MGKVWSIFFAGAAVVAIVVSWLAPSLGWWFPVAPQTPDGASVSPLGSQIDHLFYVILVITSVVFVGTQAALGYILWRFGRGDRTRGDFVHGSHVLEVVWTLVPAALLLFIALYQMDTWAKFRVVSTFNREAMSRPIAEVTARQFEWRIRYPAPGKTLASTPQPDDLYAVNNLHAPIGRPVVIRLRSEDVLHSFFLPHLRIKQDAVPGMVIPVWFEASRGGTYELVCAELCGWGHYKMQGRLTATTESEFNEYLRQLQKTQSDDGVNEPAVAAREDARKGEEQ